MTVKTIEVIGSGPLDPDDGRVHPDDGRSIGAYKAHGWERYQTVHSADPVRYRLRKTTDESHSQ